MRYYIRCTYKSGRVAERAIFVTESARVPSEMLPKFAAAAVLAGILAAQGITTRTLTQNTRTLAQGIHYARSSLSAIFLFLSVVFCQECFTEPGCAGPTVDGPTNSRECCAGTETGMSYGFGPGNCEVEQCIGKFDFLH